MKAWANTWKQNNYHWNDQDSDDHVTTVLYAMAADDAASRGLARLLVDA